jgi:hypothetical protein
VYQQVARVANTVPVMLMSATENHRENSMRRYFWLALTALPLLLPAAARADDVSDAMKEAMRAYEAGKIGAARTALSEAVQLLSQRAATGLGAALPAPLSGWQAAEVETNTAALGLLGGGNVASRKYTNGQGQTVEIQVAADSPIVAQLGMIMTNPMLAGAMGKLIRIGNQRAIQTSNNEIQMLVDNRILVTIGGSANDDAKLAYAKAIDIAKLSGE